MKKGIVILGAGTEACEGIKIAKTMGLSLIIVDQDPLAPGFEYADHKIYLSTYAGTDIATQVDTLRNTGVSIDGVIAMCADVPLSAAIIAKRLSLPGMSIESAHGVADKLLMKDRLKAMDIPIPLYCQIFESTTFNELAKRLCTPFVIKPVDSRGARGVQLIDAEHNYAQAVALAKSNSPTQRVMAEQYLSGPQVSTETLVECGHCTTLGFSDRNYEWLDKTKPFFIENGGDAPSRLSASDQNKLVNIVERAALVLGIKQGVAKGDMVLTPEGAKVIEVAGRLSGGYFSTTQIPIATGVNFIEQAIKLALGEKLEPRDIAVRNSKAVAIRYLDAMPGIVADVSGSDEVEKLEGFELMGLNIQRGYTIEALSNHTQRAGFVIFSGENKEQAIQRAQAAIQRIHIDYQGQ